MIWKHRVWQATIAWIAVAGLLVGCEREMERAQGGMVRQAAAAGQAPDAAQEEEMARFQTLYPTGERETSSLLIEKIVPQQVPVGQRHTYQLRVTNLTDAPLSGVVVRELIPEGFEIVQSNPPLQQGPGGQPQWILGELAPGQTVTIEAVGLADQAGQVNTCMVVEYQPTVCASIQVINPQLAVEKQVPQQASICQPIIYRYTVTNTGTGVAENVVVRDPLPEGLVTEDGQQAVQINVGQLPQGQSRTYEVRLNAQRTGEFASRAVATSQFGETASARVGTTVLAPQLAVDIQGPEQPYVGTPATYQIVVQNTGDYPAEQVQVAIDPAQNLRLLPAGQQGEQVAENGRIVRTLGEIPPGQARQISVNVMGTAEGQVALQAVAEGVCAPEVSDTMQAYVATIPALLLSVVDEQDPVSVGGDTVYTISVKNQGSGPDRNVRLQAQLPQGMTFVGAEGPTQVNAVGQQLNFGPVDLLPAGEVVTWRVRARAQQPGDQRIEVQMLSEWMQRPVIEMEPTRLIP